MGKIKFEPNQWIKFQLEDITIVGRTILTSDGKKFVGILDALGNAGHLPWKTVESKAVDLCKLSFLKTKREEEFLSTHKICLRKQDEDIQEEREVEEPAPIFIGATLGSC